MISQTLMVKEIDSHLLKFQSPLIHVICDMDKIAFVIPCENFSEISPRSGRDLVTISARIAARSPRSRHHAEITAKIAA